MTTAVDVVDCGGHRGRLPSSLLTKRQREALEAYARTGNQRQAAEALGIGYQTVKNHLTEAYEALDVGGGIDAFRAMGWLEVP